MEKMPMSREKYLYLWKRLIVVLAFINAIILCIVLGVWGSEKLKLFVEAAALISLCAVFFSAVELVLHIALLTFSRFMLPLERMMAVSLVGLLGWFAYMVYDVDVSLLLMVLPCMGLNFYIHGVIQETMQVCFPRVVFAGREIGRPERKLNLIYIVAIFLGYGVAWVMAVL